MSPQQVDLRSDTVTRPTPEMRAAIAAAEVGDDVLGDDPTVQRLEQQVAELLGKEAALLFPSGIMANETALLLLARPGTEVIVSAASHILDLEEGAAAHWSGVQLREVPAPAGQVDAADVRAAIRPSTRYQMRTSVVCLENTHSSTGGRVLTLERMRAVREVARERGIAVHLDGARLWNASVASGVEESAYAAEADTAMVTLSKGLGCPVGSLLAGPADLMEEAWRIRRRLGGGMRQAGLLAAAGLYALNQHRARLAEDHRRARDLAEGLGGIAGLRVEEPETNFVMVDLPASGEGAAAAAARLAQRGVLASVFGAHRLRFVTHLDVGDEGIERAIAVAGELFGN